MSDARNTISPEGKAEAEAELEHRRGARRAEIVDAIKVAREFGDLSENAEYHAAREEQGMNEARIRVLEHHLASAEVRDPATTDAAAVGSRVSYRDGTNGKVAEITLAHPLEADLSEGKVSVDSPVGAALLNGRAGEQVRAETARGTKQIEILTVG